MLTQHFDGSWSWRFGIVIPNSTVTLFFLVFSFPYFLDVLFVMQSGLWVMSIIWCNASYFFVRLEFCILAVSWFGLAQGQRGWIPLCLPWPFLIFQFHFHFDMFLYISFLFMESIFQYYGYYNHHYHSVSFMRQAVESSWSSRYAANPALSLMAPASGIMVGWNNLRLSQIWTPLCWVDVLCMQAKMN